jgi:glycerol-3-phosphate O-acyltransferase
MPKPSNINHDLEKLLNAMLKDAAGKDSTVPLEDKLKIIDRALKLEQLKAKIQDDSFGKDYDLGDTE